MRLSTQDASFIYSETASSPMHGTSIAVFEGEIPFEEIVSSLESRLHLIPRYRQRLAFVPFNLAHAKWVEDDKFRLENHLLRESLPRGAHPLIWKAHLPQNPRQRSPRRDALIELEPDDMSLRRRDIIAAKHRFEIPPRLGELSRRRNSSTLPRSLSFC